MKCYVEDLNYKDYIRLTETSMARTKEEISTVLKKMVAKLEVQDRFEEVAGILEYMNKEVC